MLNEPGARISRRQWLASLPAVASFERPASPPLRHSSASIPTLTFTAMHRHFSLRWKMAGGDA